MSLKQFQDSWSNKPKIGALALCMHCTCNEKTFDNNVKIIYQFLKTTNFSRCEPNAIQKQQNNKWKILHTLLHLIVGGIDYRIFDYFNPLLLISIPFKFTEIWHFPTPRNYSQPLPNLTKI